MSATLTSGPDGGRTYHLVWQTPVHVEAALNALIRSAQTSRRWPTFGRADLNSDAPRARLGLDFRAANPTGRVLSGNATKYWARHQSLPGATSQVALMSGDGEEVLTFPVGAPVEPYTLDTTWSKFSLVDVAEVQARLRTPHEREWYSSFTQALGACGVQVHCDGRGLTGHPVIGDGPEAWQASLRASREAMSQESLQTPPLVSVLLASKRSDCVSAVLADLAAGDYPEIEVLLGTHGWTASKQQEASWADLGLRLRCIEVDDSATLGGVLGALSQHSDGSFLAKVDDDDRYGSAHIRDLLLAWRYSGADLIGKGARFVYLRERDETLDRGWTVPERYGATMGGGTLLLSTATLLEVGGWADVPRHVDAQLAESVRSHGGQSYRTHGLDYLYTRGTEGHTWQVDQQTLVDQAATVWPGVPVALGMRHST